MANQTISKWFTFRQVEIANLKHHVIDLNCITKYLDSFIHSFIHCQISNKNEVKDV